MDGKPKTEDKKVEDKKVDKNWLGKPKKNKDEVKEDQEDRMLALSTLVRLGILIWSGGILTLAYIKLPPALGIPEQKLDPTFIASVFTGVLATFGVQAGKKANGANGSAGISKADMERLIEAAARTAPAQTIRIEQQPLTIGTQPPTVSEDGAPPVVPPKKP